MALVCGVQGVLCFLVENGDLYTFGEEEGGKLGLDDTVEKRCLNHVAGISDNVVSVSCGGSHTAVLNGQFS